jgi:hypothetical protein
MPIKIYYSGNCVSFNTSTPPPPPEKNKIENPELDFQPKEKKEYKLNSKSKQKLFDNGLYGFDKKKYDLLFLTCTYNSKLKNKTSNKHLSNFLKYLKKVDRLNGYLWVKEFQKNGTAHYHLLMDYKVKYNFKKSKKDIYDKTGRRNYWKMHEQQIFYLQKHWNKFSKQTDNPSNSLDVERIMKNSIEVIHYLGKYISKGSDFPSYEPVWGCSYNWKVQPITFSYDNDVDLINYLRQNRRKNLKNTENGYYKTDYTLHWKVNRQIIKKNWDIWLNMKDILLKEKHFARNRTKKVRLPLEC